MSDHNNYLCALSRAPLVAPVYHNKHLEEDIQAYMDAIVQGLLEIEQWLKRSDLHKSMTHFVKRWLGTVESAGQRKDKLRAWFNDIIQYCLKSQLLMVFW